MAPELIVPDWPAPSRVRALVTTRALGDMRTPASRARLRLQLPSDPVWLKQVHGIEVLDASCSASGSVADGSYAKQKNIVCAVTVADCMPVLLAHEAGEAVAIAHAGWRGLAAGVIESAIGEMQVPGERLLAWLGPAIGPAAYEVGEEVRAAFLERDAGAQAAFAPARPGHWLLDLYAVARRRLGTRGVRRIFGGDFCTFSDSERFYSYRRDAAKERMAAAIWLE
ncbi:MAG: peptidoglycan editing factor PgeF [Pseudomonadota bacterium]